PVPGGGAPRRRRAAGGAARGAGGGVRRGPVLSGGRPGPGDSDRHGHESAVARPPDREPGARRGRASGHEGPRVDAMNRHGRPWIESMLVAYVAHQLARAQRAAVDDVLREDLEARTIVSVLRGTGEAVRAAFEQPLHEAVPPRLLAALAAAGGGKATDTVVP